MSARQLQHHLDAAVARKLLKHVTTRRCSMHQSTHLHIVPVCGHQPRHDLVLVRRQLLRRRLSALAHLAQRHPQICMSCKAQASAGIAGQFWPPTNTPQQALSIPASCSEQELAVLNKRQVAGCPKDENCFEQAAAVAQTADTVKAHRRRTPPLRLSPLAALPVPAYRRSPCQVARLLTVG